jgi:hypothetical protein
MGNAVKNVTFDVQGDMLVIMVDLSREYGTSASGKSVIIATTGGNIDAPGLEDVKVGVNVYRPQQQGSRNGRSW